MAETPNKIILDFERMKYPHTGLYHFCLELGKALLTNADASETGIYFFITGKLKGLFGSQAHYINQRPTHKLILPDTRSFKVWHATHQGTGYFPFTRKIPVVLTIHDLNFMHDAGKADGKKEKHLQSLQRKIDRADHIVTISEFVLNDLRAHTQMGNKPVSVIYNGCNVPADVVITRPSLAPQAPFLFAIGTITEKKNFHVLPSLLVNNAYQLVIAGITQNEGYKKRIIDEAKKWGVANRLHFAGAVGEQEKFWYYQHCEAFVFPSIAEGFGMPVIEAMYFGKPVFLSTATSLPEIGGKQAYYFEGFDPLLMQETLKAGLGHYHSHQPVELIKEQAALFNWNQAALSYLKIYQQLSA